jgi:hypothetical protein
MAYDYGLIMAGIIGGVFFGGIGYFRAWRGGESFEIKKFAPTVIFGGIVGALMGLTGIQITEQNFAAQSALYGGLGLIIQFIFQGVVTKPATEGYILVTSGDPKTAPFDPRKFTNMYGGYLADGTCVRGLKMSDGSFRFLTFGLSTDEIADIRARVDLAEDAGLRHYRIFTSKGHYYDIENGEIWGGGG